MAHLRIYGDKRRTSHQVVIPSVVIGRMTTTLSVKLAYPVDQNTAACLDMTTQEAERLRDALINALDGRAAYLLADTEERT